MQSISLFLKVDPLILNCFFIDKVTCCKEASNCKWDKCESYIYCTSNHFPFMIEILKQVSIMTPIHGSQSFLATTHSTAQSPVCPASVGTLTVVFVVPDSTSPWFLGLRTTVGSSSRVRWLGSLARATAIEGEGATVSVTFGVGNVKFCKASIASFKSLINWSTVPGGESSSWGGEFSRHSVGKRWGTATGGRGISTWSTCESTVTSISWITQGYMNHFYGSSFTRVLPLI